MAKETTEGVVLGAEVTDGIYEIAKDKKVDFNDLQTVVKLVISAPKGIEGFGEIGPEQDNIGPAEKAQIRASAVGAMPNVPELDRDDWADVQMGVLSVYRLGRRAGKKEAEEAILKRLEAEGAEAVIASLRA